MRAIRDQPVSELVKVLLSDKNVDWNANVEYEHVVLDNEQRRDRLRKAAVYSKLIRKYRATYTNTHRTTGMCKCQLCMRKDPDFMKLRSDMKLALDEVKACKPMTDSNIKTFNQRHKPVLVTLDLK